MQWAILLCTVMLYTKYTHTAKQLNISLVLAFKAVQNAMKT